MATEAKLCQGKDIFERMNYLYQASHMIATKDKAMASYYGNIMIGCAKKAVLRMEPNIKRTMCKYCQSPLIPGETARVRLTSKPVRGVRWTCLSCLNMKRYPTKRGYKLWSDQPRSVVQEFDYTPRLKNVKTQSQTSEKEVGNIHGTVKVDCTAMGNEVDTSKNCGNEVAIKKT